MIENTIDAKQVFIAKYWGQRVGVMHRPFNEPCVDVIDEITFTWVEHILLTPLSMITDEHARELFKIHGGAIYSEFGILTIESPAEKLRNFISTQIYFRHDVYNFLISKGYYVGDGTEVTYGWAVLKTDK